MKRQCITARKRRAVMKRGRGRCHYCGTADRLGIDHKIPVSQGGSDELANLVVACRSCNSKKGAQLYEDYQAGLRYLTWLDRYMAEKQAWFERVLPAIRAAEREKEQAIMVALRATGSRTASGTRTARAG